MGFSLIHHPDHLKHTCSSTAAFLEQLPLWEQTRVYIPRNRGCGGEEPPVALVQLAGHMAAVSSP